MKKQYIILIIDNQALDAEMSKKHIKSILPESKVIIVDKFSEVNSYIKKVKPDLIISKAKLSDFNISDVFKIIIKHNKNTPLIINAGHSDDMKQIDENKYSDVNYTSINNIKELEDAIKDTLKLELAIKPVSKKNALAESDARFKTLANYGSTMIWSTDKYKSCNFLNQAWQDFTGKKIEEKDDDFDWTDNIHPEDLNNSRTKFKKAFEKKEPFTIDYRLKRKDGEYLWITNTGTPMYDDTGDFTGYLGQCYDINDRKIIEESIKQNEKFLNSIFNSVQDGISVLDKDLNILKTNWIMEQWYAENMPLKGKKCYEAYHNSEEICEVCPTLRCLKTGKQESDIISGYPGSDKWFELFSYPVKDDTSGDITGVVEFVRDISSRKIAEEELTQSEKDYRTLFNNIAQGFVLHEIIFDKSHVPVDFIFLKANPAFEKITGMKISDIIGKTGKEVMPELESHWLHLWWDIALTGGAINYENYSKTFKKHLDIWVISAKKGQFAILFNDITEKKKTQEAIKHSERNYREIFNSTSEGILIQDIKTGKIIDANKAVLHMFGYKLKEELKNKFLSDFLQPDKNDEDCLCGDLLEIFDHVIKEGNQSFNCKLVNKNNNSFKAKVSLKKASIGGKTVILGVIRDDNIE